jgi:hypothetical protein
LKDFFFERAAKALLVILLYEEEKKGLQTIYKKLTPWFGQEQETNNYESINH